jgi:hypothetical protein
LRVLGIIALDTLHMLRHSTLLPRTKINDLATVLDFLGCANAEWDHKNLCAAEYHAIGERLKNAGLRSCVEQYLSRLQALESRRPLIGGDHRRFDQVRLYREEVARLALAMAAAIALNATSLDEGIRATHDDSDVNTLFRILMQCQIIDDVMDYSEDLSGGLPSFLTASASISQAMELTAYATRSYAASARASDDSIFPLRIALRTVTLISELVVRLARPAPAVTLVHE